MAPGSWRVLRERFQQAAFDGAGLVTVRADLGSPTQSSHVSIYPPSPFGSDPRFKKWVNESGDNYRIRPYPSLQHAESDWMDTDEAFDYLLELTVENWVVVKSLSGMYRLE